MKKLLGVIGITLVYALITGGFSLLILGGVQNPSAVLEGLVIALFIVALIMGSVTVGTGISMRQG